MENNDRINFQSGAAIIFAALIAVVVVGFFGPQEIFSRAPADELPIVIFGSPRPGPIHDFQTEDKVRVDGVEFPAFTLSGNNPIGEPLSVLRNSDKIKIIGGAQRFDWIWYWPVNVIQGNLVLRDQDVWIPDDSILTKIESPTY